MIEKEEQVKEHANKMSEAIVAGVNEVEATRKEKSVSPQRTIEKSQLSRDRQESKVLIPHNNDHLCLSNKLLSYS